MNKKQKVGALTIGQSPRIDVTPSLKGIFGDAIELIEAGALDRFTMETVSAVAPTADETTYVSRMRTGEQVKISKAKLLPLLQEELTKLEAEVSAVLMLCTGDFPTLQKTKPILYPDKILFHMVKAVMEEGKLGIIIPLEEQKETLLAKWAGFEVCTEAATPYEQSDVLGAAKKLKEQGATLIVLDCIGYNEEHKAQAMRGSGLPVLLPRTILARVAMEYI